MLVNILYPAVGNSMLHTAWDIYCYVEYKKIFGLQVGSRMMYIFNI
jgi:hypothetical protein